MLIGVQRALLRPQRVVVGGGGGGGGVTLDATAIDAGLFGGSVTTTTAMTVASGATLLLVCAWGASHSASDFVGVSWDSTGTPQSMTLIQGEGSTSALLGAAKIWGLVAPTAGNKTLSFSNSVGHPFACTMASFFGSNASLASAVPSGSIIHGRSNGTTEASWNIAGTSDSLTVPSGKMGLIMNYCENGISNSASWSAATQSTSSRRLGMRVGNTSPLTLTITPDIADVTGGIAVVISS